MLPFNQKKTPVIGIDITSTSVKMLEFGQTSSGYRVEHYAVEPLPANAVNEKTIADGEAVGESIRKALKQSGTKTRHCAMAVPGSAVITKIITMPASLGEDELESQIQLEADQYIPYALEEVNLDFDVLGPSEGNPETVDVLLAASRSENVDMRVQAAEAAGLTPRIMDVEAYAIENMFALLSNQVPAEGRDKTIAVIDIGATMTSLNIIRDQKMIYTREQPFGGRQLTEEVMHAYGLTYEEAGRKKREGGLPADYATELLGPFKETAVQQVNRFLQFFYSASQFNSVDHIVLGGGCAAINGLNQQIEASLGISTTIGNPFSLLSLGSRINPQTLGTDAPSLLIACGLAIRSFD